MCFSRSNKGGNTPSHSPDEAYRDVEVTASPTVEAGTNGGLRDTTTPGDTQPAPLVDRTRGTTPRITKKPQY